MLTSSLDTFSSSLSERMKQVLEAGPMLGQTWVLLSFLVLKQKQDKIKACKAEYKKGTKKFIK